MLRPKHRKTIKPSRTFSKSTYLQDLQSYDDDDDSKGTKKWTKKQWFTIIAIIFAFLITMFVVIGPPSSKTSSSSSSMRAAVAFQQHSVQSINIPEKASIPSMQIYVSIATLGDHACPITINDLFKKAKYPQNIMVGIYQQNGDGDPDCLGMMEQCNAEQALPQIVHQDLKDITLLCKMKDHIIINKTTVKDGAKGPVYGRFMSMKLMPSTVQFDFIMMIDSHTLFRQDWDEFTMNMWFGITPNYHRAVLTHYPWGAEHLEKRIQENNAHSYHICGSIYERMSLSYLVTFKSPSCHHEANGPNFMVRNANGCFAKNCISPPRVPFFAGGFSFAPVQFWKEVPLDPYLLYIFNGEEFDIATRGWTHGWDFYSPQQDIVGHYYGSGPKRRSPHVGSNPESRSLRDRSEKRLNYLWGLWEERYPEDAGLSREEIGQKAELREIEKYGLGDKRTLQQFWDFAGIDPISKNITVWKESLYSNGGLPYVPYRYAG